MSESVLSRPVLGGTDGFRGVATEEPGPGKMNPETVAGLTYALHSMLAEPGAGESCVIGRDTRPSGDYLAPAAVAGAMAAGANVLYMGVAPTPAILKTAQSKGAVSAVALTASHNPAQYNGWKGTVGPDKPVGRQITDISDRYWAQVDSGLVLSTTAEHTEERPELLDKYVRLVADSIRHEFGDQRPLEGKIFVVDGANGAGGRVTPRVLRELGATVEEFVCDGSGAINEGVGAANLDGVKTFLRSRAELVANPNFVGALANDGDADRMIGVGAYVDQDGNMHFEELEGNRVMELMAEGQPGIVGTRYTNDAMIAQLEKQGIGFEFCDNGDANVTVKLRELQAAGRPWTRGGEFTGHHIDLKWLSSGDGVRMAAWLAAHAVQKKNANFYELAKSMKLWPEQLVNIELPPGVNSRELLERPHITAAVEEATVALNGTGRLLVRASGTEPLVRAWAVGQDAAVVQRTVNKLVKAIRT